MADNQVQVDVSVFMASSIHDMKNSLSLLSGMLEKFLGDLSPQTFDGYSQMAQMLYEVQRVNGNLIQLLTLYKLGNELYPFDAAPHEMSGFVADVVAQNEALFASKSITLTIDVPEELVWHFDEDLVAGAINQAMNNAANYTHDRIALIVRQSGDDIEIRVEDNGKGYPAAILAAPDALARGVNFATGSTGLGLHFAHVIASLHRNCGRHGTVHLENGGSLGGGCFVLTLP
ncbi:HAMP domain-containing sensor histidine kinase [Chitinivorax sp. PXF-14]|uniref:sensor histidine kinase n=1 Tax=Chitinivorax sp. PXF-14 TaxID=3230488 RepID=UPI00346566B3